VKSPYNGTARDSIFSVVGRFRFIEVPEDFILGTPDPQDCKFFPLKTGFPWAQFPLQAGFKIFGSIFEISNVQ
jgi:hypothetical protein